LGVEENISEESEPRTQSVDETQPSATLDDAYPAPTTFTHTNSPPHMPPATDCTSHRWSSGGSSTASEESLATPAELEEFHQTIAGTLDATATPSVPRLEKALQALQIGYTLTHDEGKQKVDGESPRKACTCANRQFSLPVLRYESYDFD
jgi:hypothetical protein